MKRLTPQLDTPDTPVIHQGERREEEDSRSSQSMIHGDKLTGGGPPCVSTVPVISLTDSTWVDPILGSRHHSPG